MTALLLAALLASPVDQLGFSSRGASLVGANVAYPRGAAIAAYNPSLAASAEDFEAAAGYSATSMHLSLNGEEHAIDQARATHVGVILPMSLGDFGGIGFSLALTLPDERILRARVLPIDRPRFLMYDNRLQRISLDVAASYAYAFGDFEFAGAFGATVLGGITGQGASFRLSENGSYRQADAAVSARLPLVAAPQGAISASWRDFHLGVLVRGPIQFDLAVGTTADMELEGLGGDIYTAISASDFYTPLKVAAGLSWSIDWLAVHAAVEFHQWSAAGDSVMTIGDVDFEGLSVDLPLAPPARGDPLNDVITPRVGAELTLPQIAGMFELALRFGGFYEPTPVGDSDLFIDSDRAGGAFGAGISTTNALWVFPQPLSLDAHVMVVGLLPRTYDSAGPASLRPDIEVSGVIVSGGGSFTIRF